MLRRTNTGGEHTARPVAITAKGQVTVALIRLERALEHLAEAEQQDVLAELLPIARLARSRAESCQSARVGVPLVGRLTT